MAKKFRSNFKAKKIGKILLIGVAAVLSVLLLGGIANNFAGKFLDRNPDNLIKVDDNYLKDTKTDYGLTIEVDDDGTIHLKGDTSANMEKLIQKVTLPAGTYTLSGVNEVDISKLTVKAFWGSGNVAYANTDSGTFTLDAETEVSIFLFIQGAEDGKSNIAYANRIIRPVLVEGEEAGKFYK